MSSVECGGVGGQQEGTAALGLGVFGETGPCLLLGQV